MGMADALENVCDTLLTLTLPLTQITPKADSFRLVVSRRGKTSPDEYKNFGGPAAAMRYPNHNRDEPKRPPDNAPWSAPSMLVAPLLRAQRPMLDIYNR